MICHVEPAIVCRLPIAVRSLYFCNAEYCPPETHDQDGPSMSTVAEPSQHNTLNADQRLGSRLDTLLTDGGWKRACLMFLFLGVAVRLVRYLLCFPLWNDEMALVENFLNRDFFGLLEPLANRQVAPILFMWTELVVIKFAGVSEYSLRLFPIVCGIASLFVFYHFAGQYLKGLPLLMAVAVFSVSYYPIRHAADTFVTVILLSIVTAYWKSPQWKWLLVLTAVTPLALGYSFPSVFIWGGGNQFITVDARICSRFRRRTSLVCTVQFLFVVDISSVALCLHR